MLATLCRQDNTYDPDRFCQLMFAVVMLRLRENVAVNPR